MTSKESMHIVIDGRMVSNTGIGRCLECVVRSMFKLPVHHHITVLVNSDSERTRGFSSETRKLRFPAPIYSLREQFVLPFELRTEHADLVHYPNFNVPLADCTPCVVTLSDIIYYLFPEACPSWVGHQYARSMIRQSARKARTIITVSEHSKQDLMSHIGVAEDKIEVVHPAVDHVRFNPNCSEEDIQAVAKKFRIRKPYIFYVGNHEPRKNLLRLIRAYKRLRIRKDFQLVIGGRLDSRRHELYAELRQLCRAGEAIICDEISEPDLPPMYAAASLFVFPSLYEGFGLPPLEAMAAGTPVACSCTSSLPEVVGDAARTFVPTEEEDIAAAMEEVLTHPSLMTEMRRRGILQAQRFSWHNAAVQTMSIYERAAES